MANISTFSIPETLEARKIVLFVLERLNDEWDLIRKNSVLETRNVTLISMPRLREWLADSVVVNTQFAAALNYLKENHLIVKFEDVQVGWPDLDGDDLSPALLVVFNKEFTEHYLQYKKLLSKNLSSTVSPTEGTSSKKPTFFKENGRGYIKFYKEGPRIFIGKVDTRKCRLVETLIDAPSAAKNVSVVFDAIKHPKDSSDGRLKDSYTAPARQREIIDYAMKELQTIKGLKGRIFLVYQHGGDTVALNLK
jgi:hypothetical protein